MDSYCVYLNGARVKTFSDSLDAFYLSYRLELFLIQNGMDKSLVKVCKEVL